MKILITGGAGFIGSHLSEQLISQGHSLTILDSFETSSRKNLTSVKFMPAHRVVEGSILDRGLLESLMSETEYVFHLAAAVGVFNIIKNPLSSLLTNIRGTENILEFADKYSIPVLITSSSEVYGKNTSDSLREDSDRIIGSPTKLRWSYSEAKAIDESLAYAYHLEKELETRIVRFFNTVGPRQLGAYGMVVPRFVESALANRTISIYGDGNQTRCFAHVYDVVDATIKVAFSQKTIGKVVNIGNNSEISSRDLAEKIIRETNSMSEIVTVPYAEAYGPGFEDMERRVPDISLIKDLVGWEPKRDLSTIIADIARELKSF